MVQAGLKGTVLVAVTEELLRLVESGRVSRDWLEARLEARDLEILDAKIQPALWYPIESYERLMKTLVELESGRDPVSFLRRRGRQAAARLAESGLYAQLRGDSAAHSLDLRQVRRTLSLWAALVTFSQWSCAMESEQPRVFRIEVTEAEKFPGVLRQANAGFLEGVFSGVAQRRVEVLLEDERADRFSYRVRVGA